MNAGAKCGHAGVQFRPRVGLWRARVRGGKRTKDLGEFATIEEAIEARRAYLAKLPAKVQAGGKR